MPSIIAAGILGGILGALAAGAARRGADRLRRRMLDPNRSRRAEEDPYFNREYARPRAARARSRSRDSRPPPSAHAA